MHAKDPTVGGCINRRSRMYTMTLAETHSKEGNDDKNASITMHQLASRGNNTPQGAPNFLGCLY